MIQSMFVKNFILIDELSLDFDSPFSAFTGETGAGKSLFIDALSILCGSRISTSDIQNGKREALVEAQFKLAPSHPSLKVLEEAGYELEDDTFILTRTFNVDGKSITKINNRPTTVSFIKEMMANVVDIHSQHDSQYLLHHKNHLQLLDSFCDDETLHKEVKQQYREYKLLKSELDQTLNEDFNMEDLDYFQFQLSEIENLNLKAGELETLESSQKEMANFEKNNTKINHALSLLEDSNYEVLYELQKELNGLENEIIKVASNELSNAYYIIDEQVENLKAYASSIEFDEQEYDGNQQRIFDLNNIIRKHGHSIQDVFDKQDEIASKIQRMEHRESYIKEQTLKIKKAYEFFITKATSLSELRKAKALLLEEQIQLQLSDLHLTRAQFKIQFMEDANAHGIDKIEFYISMNQGEALRPLAKVISGGELSRLMLGLKSIFTKLQHIETIIFDEIDTGVSGNVAFAIGKKMKQIANDAQVIAITHLAPVAAWADDHYFVEKQEINDKTLSHIRNLSLEERWKELASISSNSNSEQALIAAKELFDSCR